MGEIKDRRDDHTWWEGWNRLAGGKMQEEGIFVAAEQAENARPS